MANVAEEGPVSDPESDSGVEEFSGMEQPPLIKQLRTILAEYPDDGQIIKELVQNAEDAVASHMKILFDGRSLNKDETKAVDGDMKNGTKKSKSKKFPYRKFFKAPALCFYNNEVFSENDWRGIKMIYSSVKEEDPLKVGRFGLGFKSVFHITDYPCIVSGDRILLMNPHEKVPGQVCITIKLKDLKKCKRLKLDELLAALSDTFGFSEDSLKSGQYCGTIFWFPLRETPSDLSDTCYDHIKVLDLFRSFQSEAVHSLLFLKSLCKVEMYCRGADSEYDLPNQEAFFSVELDDADNRIQQDRRQFLEDVKSACGTIPNEDIVCVAHPTFKTCYKTTSLQIYNEQTSSWVVINIYKGGNMSEKLQHLINDKDLSYMPYVGAAVPLDNIDKPLKGHIFCFLPLPQEKKSLTGLPVHFNGFFALSQNRRHLKWASEDQETLHMHRDKSIEWNECLVNEVLPGVYIRLIKEMIDNSKRKGNTQEAVSAVYRCIPDDSSVDDKWDGCIRKLYEQLLSTEFVFLPKHSKWVLPNQPLYTMFDNQNITGDKRDTVIKLLQFYNSVESTEVPKHIWHLLKKKSNPNDVSPVVLKKILESEDIYRHKMNRNEKLTLLEYILKDHNHALLFGLELLPLENGSFTSFLNAGGKANVFYCSKQETSLFPGLANNFISNDISTYLQGNMKEIANSGKFHLRMLTVDDTVSLLDKTIHLNLGSAEPVHLKMIADKRFENWIEKVWAYIFSRFPDSITRFSNLPLIPCLISGNWNDGTWKNGEIHLYNMTHTFLVKNIRDVEELSLKICEAIERLSVKILPPLPTWLNIEKLPCVFTPNGPSIARMFEQISKYPHTINMFNNSCRDSDAEAMIELLTKVNTSLSRNTIMLLQRLKIFQQKVSSESNPIRSSVSDCNHIVSQTVHFPVRFPKPVLTANSHYSLSVAKVLEASEISEDQMTSWILQSINTSTAYSSNEVHLFMLWYLDNIHKFKDKRSIIDLARGISFVDNGEGKLKPADLYDPRDKSLATLFAGERKFPVGEFSTDSRLNALKHLGLGTKETLTANCMYTTARILDQICEDVQTRDKAEVKAKMFLQILEERSELLSSTVRETGCQLHLSICSFKCIPHKKDKPHSYPQELIWKGSYVSLCCPSELKSTTFSEVAGSVIPLVKVSSAKLGQCFNWNLPPEARTVSKQLENIVAAYNSENKASLLPLISSVYKAMMDRTSDMIKCQEFQCILQRECIWWGDGFCTPSQMVLEQNTHDIDLKPYMYKLPVELELMRSFFSAVKCCPKQDLPVLLKVLQMISDKHKTLQIRDKAQIRKDLQLVLLILGRLFQDKVSPAVCGDNLLFPVHTGDDDTLVLEPYLHCTYCDSQWLKDLTDESGDDEDILYVHAEVPALVAEGLGVKSLRKQLMSDAEGLEEWGQEEPLTRRLHNILKDAYMDGLAVPKEIIQNADDARAATVIFIYDERENEDARTQLLDEGMATCQGPALWAYNDALFSEKDLKNITKLSGGTKESDTTKIGKFGLGFCSVYNLTDVPSFVSGHNMVIFDPHTKFLNNALPGKSPGLKINLKNLKNKRLLKRMHNQFKPFQQILGCDLFQSDPSFEGTLFRLPLRTQQQAAVSEIKNTWYTRDEMITLLTQFVEACGSMLLFTQNVKELKLSHIPAGASPEAATLLCTVTKNSVSMAPAKTMLDICSEMKKNKTLQHKPLEIIERVKIQMKTRQTDMIRSLANNDFETHWLVSWATGMSKALQLSYSTNITGALPLGSVAIPIVCQNDCTSPRLLQNSGVGFYKSGHIFCFLPLPITSSFEFHVNGSFAVVSSRRGLKTNTEDDKYSYDTQWNEALLFDAVARSLINLLVHLHQFKLIDSYKFFQLWPTNPTAETEVLKRGFYENVVVNDSAVFESYGRWLSISQCIFLNKNMTKNQEIVEAALATIQKFRSDPGLGVVYLPSVYLSELETSQGWKEKANVVTEEGFFTQYFLPHIGDNYWLESEENLSRRKRLLLFCLRHSTPIIDTLLKNVECIPTEPGMKLRKPSDTVHPEKSVSKLFKIDEGRFPENSFRSHDILSKLIDLGMMTDTLTTQMVIDRAMTVQTLLSQGFANEAVQRCQCFLEYLGSHCRQDQEILKQLGTIEWLPVKKKPRDWLYMWHAESRFETGISSDGVCFDKACNLFFEDCLGLVCCTELILDSSKLTYSFYDKQILVQMGVNSVSKVSLQTAVNQMLNICSSKQQSKSDVQKRIEEETLFKLYEYMDKWATNEPETFLASIKHIVNQPIILLESELLPVSKVAFSVGFNCVPELYEIGRNKISKFRKFLVSVGVKDNFNIEDVIGVLQTKRHKYESLKLPPEEFKLVCQLLELLSDLVKTHRTKYNDTVNLGEDSIFAPDIDMILRPVGRLCLDDITFKEASRSMRFVHIEISRSVAENIGIATKKRRFIQDCSVGIPFEQKEELVARLQGLLDGYPCDIGIMKELIQNADDAGAEEIHFIKDYRSHSCSRIFDHFEEFQGPALLVFNDRPFSKADLEGIQKLGVGSKAADYAKTGQYGVGFNAVYNLTDLPSFLTKGPEIDEGETLCVLDPLQKHCHEYCGMRYNVSHIRTAFSDVISGYNEETIFAGKNSGTVFRFPLRKANSNLGKSVTQDLLDGIMCDFKAEMWDMLVFLRSIKKITVSNISQGSVKNEFSVSVECDDNAVIQRQTFSKVCKEKANIMKEKNNCEFLSPPLLFQYRLMSKDKNGKQKEWIIVQSLGFQENDVTDEVKTAIEKGKLGMLPVGGAALNIPEKQSQVGKITSWFTGLFSASTEPHCRNVGKIYCFLPLPMRSGLPLHVNGHFALDHEARRGLWVEEEGYKSSWNNLILSCSVAPSYIEAIKCLKTIVFSNDLTEYTEERFEEDITHFETYFPITKKAQENYEKFLVKRVYGLIIRDKEELFPLCMPVTDIKTNDNAQATHTQQSASGFGKPDKQMVFKIKWTAYQPTGHNFPIYFSPIKEITLRNTLENLLKCLGLKVTYRLLKA